MFCFHGQMLRKVVLAAALFIRDWFPVFKTGLRCRPLMWCSQRWPISRHDHHHEPGKTALHSGVVVEAAAAGGCTYNRSVPVNTRTRFVFRNRNSLCYPIILVEFVFQRQRSCGFTAYRVVLDHGMLSSLHTVFQVLESSFNHPHL